MKKAKVIAAFITVMSIVMLLPPGLRRFWITPPWWPVLPWA